MANALMTCRIPKPPEADGLIPGGQWQVLVDAIWPSAKSAEAVMLAVNYCKARGLDPLKRPVHIVPVWNTQLRREVETVWPGISELQTTAARTHAFAGMDAPAWGPEITETFRGSVKQRDGSYRDEEMTLTFPEWCEVTVYRLVGGHRVPFVEPVYWLEAYGHRGKSDLPNDMWARRVRGQLHKCAKAASLRVAFPEELGSDYAAEEMEGKIIDHGGALIEGHAVEHGEPADAQDESNESDSAGEFDTADDPSIIVVYPNGNGGRPITYDNLAVAGTKIEQYATAKVAKGAYDDLRSLLTLNPDLWHRAPPIRAMLEAMLGDEATGPVSDAGPEGRLAV